MHHPVGFDETFGRPFRGERFGTVGVYRSREEKGMLAALLLLLLAAILFGFGFATHALFWIAAIVLVVWLVGWLVRPAGGRWYYW